MPLTAINTKDGQVVESFSVNKEDWDLMRSEPLGTYHTRGTNWPAVLKRSIRGLQFFAHAPGYIGAKPEPESMEHLQAKAQIANSLRKAGIKSWVEFSGKTPTGEAWQADVFCEADTHKIAFEVQLAQQTLEDYENRSAKYKSSGVQSIWLVRGGKHFMALSKAVVYRLANQGKPYLGRPGLFDLAAVCLEINKERLNEHDGMQVVVFPNGGHQRISLAEFATGVANGRLSFGDNAWQWRV